MWDRLGMLMDHDKERRAEIEYWNIIQSTIVDYVLHDLGLSSLYSEAEVLRAFGLLRTNALYHPHSKGIVLYPTFSFLSHSCISNASYAVNKDDSLVLRAQVEDKAKKDDFYVFYLFRKTSRAARRSPSSTYHSYTETSRGGRTSGPTGGWACGGGCGQM